MELEWEKSDISGNVLVPFDKCDNYCKYCLIDLVGVKYFRSFPFPDTLWLPISFIVEFLI